MTGLPHLNHSTHSIKKGEKVAASLTHRAIFICIMTGWLLLMGITAYGQKVRPIKITEANARTYRDSVNLKVFGSTVFPYGLMPDAIVTNVNSIEYYSGFPYGPLMYPGGNLDSIDLIEVAFDNNTIDFPTKAKVYLFHPHNSNGKLFIYHSGHCVGSATAEDIIGNNGGVEPGRVIPALIEEGYTVLAVPMLHYQSVPPVGVVCGYNLHDPFFHNSNYPFPLSLMLKPLIASLNWLGRSNYASIYMTGLSGGGWTSSFYPAIDSSISISFPVAGSWPLPIRMDLRDSEQAYAPLFADLLDYHELYTLGCLAPPRKMLQINNRYDACCYKGAEAHVFYVDSVARALEGTGGLYKFYMDESEFSHQISRKALSVMKAFINNESGSLVQLPADTVTNGAHYTYDIAANFLTSPAPAITPVTYSLLKGPGWISLDTLTGMLEGDILPGSIINSTDTISFKAEDSTGRFVVFNYQLKKRRETPYFFAMQGNDTSVYYLPPFSHSMNSVSPLSANSFYSNNPLLNIIGISSLNNSVIKLDLNMPLSGTDSIAYNGYSGPFPITFDNGSRIEDFGLTEVSLIGGVEGYATAGMMRFNSETGKFEYFNGIQWIDMN